MQAQTAWVVLSAALLLWQAAARASRAPPDACRVPLHAPLEVGTALCAEVLDDPEGLQQVRHQLRDQCTLLVQAAGRGAAPAGAPTLNLTTGFLAASFFCTASAMAVAASGDCLAMSAISSSRYTEGCGGGGHHVSC